MNIAEAMGEAFAVIADQITETVMAILPIAMTILGLMIVVGSGIKLIKRIADIAIDEGGGGGGGAGMYSEAGYEEEYEEEVEERDWRLGVEGANKPFLWPENYEPKDLSEKESITGNNWEW